MAQNILKKAAKYQRVAESFTESQQHLKNVFLPEPTILKPNLVKKEKLPDDITDFPMQKHIPIPETIPYQEGKYVPASIPVMGGYFPTNMYLQQGKVYNWCACGCSSNGTWCDGICNNIVTRARPVAFNVSETGYYKICNCKFSANAPFCNGTHQTAIRYHHSTHRGFVEIWGFIGYWMTCALMYYNWYT